MLPFESRSTIINNPDPYRACHNGISEHPHYHDCHNCGHAKDATCKYGDAILKSAELKKWIKVGEDMLASYPKLDPKRLP